jgi:tetratricopeptide (TPR) repeat protein
MEGFRYDLAREKILEVLNSPNIDKGTRRRILFQAITLSLSHGEPIIPELLGELRGYLESDMNTEDKAETLYIIARAEKRMGRYSEAVNFASKSLSLYQKLAKPAETVHVLITLGSIYTNQGDWDALKKVTTEALKLANESGDSRGYGRGSFALCLLP